MSNNCAYCDHAFESFCNSITYMYKGGRVRLCNPKKDNTNHDQHCYKRYRDLNK